MRPGLMQAMLGRDAEGSLVRKCGVMAVVRSGGVLYLGDPPHQRLQPV